MWHLGGNDARTTACRSQSICCKLLLQSLENDGLLVGAVYNHSSNVSVSDCGWWWGYLPCMMTRNDTTLPNYVRLDHRSDSYVNVLVVTGKKRHGDAKINMIVDPSNKYHMSMRTASNMHSAVFISHSQYIIPCDGLSHPIGPKSSDFQTLCYHIL